MPEETPREKLRRMIQEECHRQIDDFFGLQADEEGHTMMDVVEAHVALGYAINVGISVRHPEEAGRAEEDPSLAEAEAEPPTRIITG